MSTGKKVLVAALVVLVVGGIIGANLARKGKKGSPVTLHTVGKSDIVARVTVEDEGPGIPPANLESIFDRFYTERPGENFGRNSGLGLSIARQIIEGAGGRIYAENRASASPDVSGGARLIVELPVAPLDV